MDMRMIAVGLLALSGMGAGAQQLSLSRAEATVLVQPYAPNVVRVSLSLRKGDALAGPGYGVTAKANGAGWVAQSGAAGDVLRSSRMVVTVAPQGEKYVPTGTAADIAKFFNGSTPGVGISISTAEGAPLLKMQGWQMSVPNHKDMNADILHDRRSGDAPFFQVGATFASPPDEHYYGLGAKPGGISRPPRTCGSLRA